MRDQSEEVIPIKRDQNFMETYHEILKKLDKLKIVQLRSVGKAVANAIELSEKITKENKVEYIRMTSEQFQGKDRKTVLCTIRLKKTGDTKTESKQNYKEKSSAQNSRPPIEKSNLKYRQK